MSSVTFPQAVPDHISDRVPKFIRFSGLLKDGSGRPLNGEANVNFAIYDEPTGGASLWDETQIVQFSDGRYSILLGLGSQTGIPGDLFRSGESRWLGIHLLLDGEEEQQQPRIFLASVPYALKAADADTLGGLPVSAFARNPTFTTEDSGNETPGKSGPTLGLLPIGNVPSGSQSSTAIPHADIWTANVATAGLQNPVLQNPATAQTISGQGLTLSASVPFKVVGDSQFSGNNVHSGSETFANINKVCLVGSSTYPTISAAVVDPSCATMDARGYNTTETWSTDVLGAITRPVRIVAGLPLEIDLAHAQTIRTNNVSLEFSGQNPAMAQIGAASPQAQQTAGLRFKAKSPLNGPMISVTGPVLGFNLQNVHLDCNDNAGVGIRVDRMQQSVWSGVISADNCTSIGFKFQNGATGPNQDTNFNQIGILFVTRSPSCVEFDANQGNTSNFAHNIINEIGCSLLGAGAAADGVYFQGADGNWISRIWCQLYKGGGKARSCIHFSEHAYSNQIGSVDPGIPSAAGVIQDAGNSYPNWIGNIGLGNWIASGGNSVGGEVIPNGRILWTSVVNGGLQMGTDGGNVVSYGMDNSSDAVISAQSGSFVMSNTGGTKVAAFNVNSISGTQFFTLPNRSGTLLVDAIPPVAMGTAAKLTGTGACATITSDKGGAWAGQFTCTGPTGASTIVIIPGSMPPNGFSCWANDLTTGTNILRQSAVAANACTIAGTVNTNDVLTFGAIAY